MPIDTKSDMQSNRFRKTVFKDPRDSYGDRLFYLTKFETEDQAMAEIVKANCNIDFVIVTVAEKTYVEDEE